MPAIVLEGPRLPQDTTSLARLALANEQQEQNFYNQLLSLATAAYKEDPTSPLSTMLQQTAQSFAKNTWGVDPTGMPNFTKYTDASMKGLQEQMAHSQRLANIYKGGQQLVGTAGQIDKYGQGVGTQRSLMIPSILGEYAKQQQADMGDKSYWEKIINAQLPPSDLLQLIQQK